MNNSIQLLSFLLSFLFGICFSFASHYHYEMVSHLKKVPRYVLTFLFILDVSLFYVLIMYYLNNGVIHIYFVIVTLVGYCLEGKITSLIKKRFKLFNFSKKLFPK